MLIKEKYAHQKWCPMVRMSAAGDPAMNAEYKSRIPDFATCRGGSCMMWRWNSRRDDDDTGYCGLAGKPIDDD